MDATHAPNWWNRECGGRDLLRVALPLVVSTMSFTIMHFCDRMFLSWFSKESMAAAMPAGMVHWTMMSFPLGVAIYSNTFIAQYHGARRPEQIGKAVWQSLRVGFYAAPLFLLIAPLAPSLFKWFGHSDELVWLESFYCLHNGSKTLAFRRPL